MCLLLLMSDFLRAIRVMCIYATVFISIDQLLRSCLIFSKLFSMIELMSQTDKGVLKPPAQSSLVLFAQKKCIVFAVLIFKTSPVTYPQKKTKTYAKPTKHP